MFPEYSKSLGPNAVYLEKSRFYRTTRKGSKSKTIISLQATATNHCPIYFDYVLVGELRQRVPVRCNYKGDYLEIHSYLGNNLWHTSFIKL